MKFTCLQEHLTQKLAMVNRTVASKASLSLLANIKINAAKDRLQLSATNLQWSVTTTFGAQVDEEGSLTIPGNILTSYISALPPQKLTCEMKKGALKVATNQGAATLRGMSAEDFPSVIMEGGKTLFELPSSVLQEALAGVTFAAAHDESRPILTGILMVGEGSTLTLAGVDGFRLSEAVVKLSAPLEEPLRAILPARSLSELSKLSKTSDTISVSVHDDEGQVVFEIGETILATRLLEGTFPAYSQIIPSESTMTATVSTDELRKAIQLSSLFTETSTNVVKFQFSAEDNEIIISANAQDVGDNRTAVPGEIDGDDATIAFNAKYVADVLSYVESISQDSVTIDIKDSLSPGVVTCPSLEGYKHIIMPVRVQE